MATFIRDGVSLNYRDIGSGLPFVFQHGLGGGLSKALALFRPPEGVRLVGFDFRGHGLSSLGPVDRIGFNTFADDVSALLDHLGIDQAVIGGISMGAGVTLNFALRHPNRALGLVLSRPAWREHPNPFNTWAFPHIASLIRTHGAAEGRQVFRAGAYYSKLVTEFPDVAEALDNQFLHPRALEFAEVLERIPSDIPDGDPARWQSLAIPVLVLANRQDPIHPFEYGEVLASRIPGAQLQELTSKSIDLARHEREVQEYIASFLQTHFLSSKTA